MIGTGPLEIKHYCPILALIRNDKSGLIEFYEGKRFSALASTKKEELYDIARVKVLPILEEIDPLACIANWNWHYIEIPVHDSNSQSRPSGPLPPIRRETPSGPPPTPPNRFK